MNAAATLPACLLRHCCERPGDVALRKKDLGRWHEWTWVEYAQQVARVAGGLRACGVESAAPRSSPTTAGVARRGHRRTGDRRASWASIRRARPPSSSTSMRHSGAKSIAEDEEQVDKGLAVRSDLADLGDIFGTICGVRSGAVRRWTESTAPSRSTSRTCSASSTPRRPRSSLARPGRPGRRRERCSRTRTCCTRRPRCLRHLQWRTRSSHTCRCATSPSGSFRAGCSRPGRRQLRRAVSRSGRTCAKSSRRSSSGSHACGEHAGERRGADGRREPGEAPGVAGGAGASGGSATCSPSARCARSLGIVAGARGHLAQRPRSRQALEVLRADRRSRARGWPARCTALATATPGSPNCCSASKT